MYLFIHLLQNRTHGTRKKNKKTHREQQPLCLPLDENKTVKLRAQQRGNIRNSRTLEPSRMFNT